VDVAIEREEGKHQTGINPRLLSSTRQNKKGRAVTEGKEKRNIKRMKNRCGERKEKVKEETTDLGSDSIRDVGLNAIAQLHRVRHGNLKERRLRRIGAWGPGRAPLLQKRSRDSRMREKA
jgi:hypothetical protein